MKKLLIFGFLIFSCGLWAQSNTQVSDITHLLSIRVVLDSTDRDTVFIANPMLYATYKSSTALDSIAPSAPLKSHNKWSSNKNMLICIIPEVGTAEESDSLTATLHPYEYSENKEAYYISSNDSLFLVFDTRVTYTATAYDYLNWTDGAMYTCKLTSELWGGSDLALIFWQKAYDTSTADTYLNVEIYLEQ